MLLCWLEIVLLLACLPVFASNTIATNQMVVNVSPPVPRLSSRARAIIVENLSVLALFQARCVGQGGARRFEMETGIMEQ
jgi:hypothetical protein